ncbi:hypothetical protein BZG73_14745 [Salinivibrio siamensis]|uniref:Uncharacterized protein n=1 Tax=Salinivibrio siamensis TaxID=414286 RepID=A0ABX3K5B1_9GAMM|nr:hypothetical protein [Salinivibrio siamensis]OOE80012.1 hypothetical protein BZG73_14745 [Salinivibrio siamensis]
MAAEKLTRGRLAQIIVMLTLLVVAFFWRTLVYTPGLTIIDCEGERGFCGTSQSQQLIEFAWSKEQDNVIFSVVSDKKPHSAYWEEEGSKQIEISDQQDRNGEKITLTWQWKTQDLPRNPIRFNLVFDQYQFKFNYPKSE